MAAATTKKEPKQELPQQEQAKPSRKTLAQLFDEPCAIEIGHAYMHQAFHIPGVGTDGHLSPIKMKKPGLKLVYHPGYGLIIRVDGKYSLTPSANMVVGHE